MADLNRLDRSDEVHQALFLWKNYRFIPGVLTAGMAVVCALVSGGQTPASAREPVLDFSLTPHMANESIGNTVESRVAGAPVQLTVPVAQVPVGHSNHGRSSDAVESHRAIAAELGGGDRPVILTFALNPIADRSVAAVDLPTTYTHETAVTQSALPHQIAVLPPDWFEGGSDAIIARLIGVAEGTRTPSGLPTPAYFGHIDPGNRAWNLGSFSYQHGAATPTEADEKQIQRLQRQAEMLLRQAAAHQLNLTVAEAVNGLDLANQAPLAALGREGYIDRLWQAHQMGLSGYDAILWARTRSFLDPDTQRWNAPGLGNTIDSISRDQERRMKAIATAQAHLILNSDSIAEMSAHQANSSTTAQSKPKPESVIDQILTLDLPDL